MSLAPAVARPRKPAGEKRAALAVYLEPKLLKKVQKLAEREHRSASAQALLIIERALEDASSS